MGEIKQSLWWREKTLQTFTLFPRNSWTQAGFRLFNMCTFYGVPFYKDVSSADLGLKAVFISVAAVWLPLAGLFCSRWSISFVWLKLECSRLMMQLLLSSKNASFSPLPLLGSKSVLLFLCSLLLFCNWLELTFFSPVYISYVLVKMFIL